MPVGPHILWPVATIQSAPRACTSMASRAQTVSSLEAPLHQPVQDTTQASQPAVCVCQLQLTSVFLVPVEFAEKCIAIGAGG